MRPGSAGPGTEQDEGGTGEADGSAERVPAVRTDALDGPTVARVIRTGKIRMRRRAVFPVAASGEAAGARSPAVYAGDRVACATAIRIEIVRKPKDQVGFAVHPRRWVIERFFAWIGRNRRLAKDFEASIVSAQAFLYAASVTVLLRRLARSA